MFATHRVLAGVCPLVAEAEMTHEFVNEFWRQGIPGEEVVPEKFRRIYKLHQVLMHPKTSFILFLRLLHDLTPGFRTLCCHEDLSGNVEEKRGAVHCIE